MVSIRSRDICSLQSVVPPPTHLEEFLERETSLQSLTNGQWSMVHCRYISLLLNFVVNVNAMFIQNK